MYPWREMPAALAIFVWVIPLCVFASLITRVNSARM
jgi:hypothetical protein